jgi:alpha-L-arabinofuranosidase
MVPRSISLLFLLAGASAGWAAPPDAPDGPASAHGVAVLLVDTDRVMGTVDKHIFGHFLEHINHSVVDGLFAEQIQDRGFEGEDFATYWESFAKSGSVEIVAGGPKSGDKSLRLETSGGRAGVRQGRISVRKGDVYDGSAWLKPER